MRRRIWGLLQRRTRPPLFIGLLVVIVCVAAETSLAHLLTPVTPVHSLDVMFLGGIVVMSVLWGLGLGITAAVVSAVAVDLFLTEPTWTLRPAKSEFLAISALFVALALLSYWISSLARALAGEVEARRDADLSAQITRLALRAPDLKNAMPSAAHSLARTLGLPSATIKPGIIPADEHQTTFTLRGTDTLATLIVPTGLTQPTLRRLRDRAVPSLESLLRAVEQRENATGTVCTSHDELQRIADEQTALRHLATLVAHNVPPAEVFNAVAREMGRILGAEHTVINRYEAGGTMVTTVGVWNYEDIVAPGSRWEFEEGTVSDLVFHTKAPGRINGYRGTDELAARLRERGVLSSVGCPIMVGRHLWGVAIASSITSDPLPRDAEVRMLDFVELAAIAIANAQSHADLITSRARLLAATDETRRRIERDLHDGTQQHLISVLLDIRTVERDLPSNLHQLKDHLSGSAKVLESALTELQDITRGLHPATLTRGGLRPALSVLARRSAVAVNLKVSGECPLPEAIEVTVYYVVSEALTNAAKHARATAIHIDLVLSDTDVRLSISDDGIGGADPAKGSGLAGLTDRVNALGGTMRITSPAKRGTTLFAEIPTRPPRHST